MTYGFNEKQIKNNQYLNDKNPFLFHELPI